MPNPRPHNTLPARRFPTNCGERPGRPGLFYVRYRDRSGARCVRYTRDYDELLRLAVELTGAEASVRRPVAVDRRLTVERMLDRWLVDAGNRLRPKTVQGYREHVRAYLKPSLGRIRLAELARSDVDALIATLRRRERPLSDSTIRGAFIALHVALNWALDAELIARNPIARMRKPEIADVAIQPPTAAEIEELLEAEKAHRLIALFTVAARTGLRQGEILGLTWADLEGDLLYVRGTLDRDTRRRGPTKTSESAAPVPLIPSVVLALRAHRARQLEERIAAGRRWREPERIFTTREGRALDGRAVTRMLHRMQDRNGLRRFRFHDLRHALATAMLAGGASPFDVMVAVRHSRIGTTVDQYGHRTPAQMARIRALMAEAAAPAR